MPAPHLNGLKPLIAIKGMALSLTELKNTGGPVDQCSIQPELPIGLFLSIINHTCVLTGVAQRASARAAYTITAENENGSGSVAIELTVIEAPIKTQREAIIHVHDKRHDLDTPRSQVDNAVHDHAMMGNMIKPHEMFVDQPAGNDKRLSHQAADNPDAQMRAEQTPELTPSPSAKLQAQAMARATPHMTPTPGNS